MKYKIYTYLGLFLSTIGIFGILIYFGMIPPPNFLENKEFPGEWGSPFYLLFLCILPGSIFSRLANRGNQFQQTAVGGKAIQKLIWYFSFGWIVFVGAVIFGIFGMFAGLGAAWGRPLRIRGKIVHGELELGTHWIKGELPNAVMLDQSTKNALEALWLHDAKKEHASVPAFSRLSWNLTALGAPPNLLRWIHNAAIEEIEHAQKCLALASGFGDRSHTFGDFPILLSDKNDMKENPYFHIGRETFLDGCLLEEFNADVALMGAKICRDSASQKVLQQIAAEERSHAALSWEILKFLLSKSPELGNIILGECQRLHLVPRPTVATKEIQSLIDAANGEALLFFGRLPDVRWAEIWVDRQRRVILKARSLISPIDSSNLGANI